MDEVLDRFKILVDEEKLIANDSPFRLILVEEIKEISKEVAVFKKFSG